MKTKVYDGYNNTCIGTFSSREEAERWLGKRAYEWNYGMMGQWSNDGKDYFDCGPRVFFIYNEKSSCLNQEGNI